MIKELEKTFQILNKTGQDDLLKEQQRFIKGNVQYNFSGLNNMFTLRHFNFYSQQEMIEHVDKERILEFTHLFYPISTHFFQIYWCAIKPENFLVIYHKWSKDEDGLKTTDSRLLMDKNKDMIPNKIEKVTVYHVSEEDQAWIAAISDDCIRSDYQEGYYKINVYKNQQVFSTHNESSQTTSQSLSKTVEELCTYFPHKTREAFDFPVCNQFPSPMITTYLKVSEKDQINFFPANVLKEIFITPGGPEEYLICFKNNKKKRYGFIVESNDEDENNETIPPRQYPTRSKTRGNTNTHDNRRNKKNTHDDDRRKEAFEKFFELYKKEIAEVYDEDEYKKKNFIFQILDL